MGHLQLLDIQRSIFKPLKPVVDLNNIPTLGSYSTESKLYVRNKHNAVVASYGNAHYY
jgi:hypothetical protein